MKSICVAEKEPTKLSMWNNLRRKLINFSRFDRLWIVLILATLFFSIAARFTINMVLSGDEPHYLVMVNSLITDHDLNLKNDYEQHKYSAFYNRELDPHINWTLVDRSGNHWYSIHGVGLPLLILPSILINDSIGAPLTMIGVGLLAIVSGVMLSKLVAGHILSFFAGIMMSLSIPFLALTGYIFPDMVIGALLAAIFVLMCRGRKSLLREAIIGVLAAVLIWIHVKTGLIAGTIILIEVIEILRSFSGNTERRHRLVSLLVPFVLISVCLQFKLTQWFGVLTPSGIYEGTNQIFQLSPLKVLLASVFDPYKGLLILSPIWFCAVIGFPEWYRRSKKQLLLVLILVIPSLLIQSTNQDWSGGWAPPSRYIAEYLPILLPALALGLEVMLSNTKTRFIVFFLVAIQVIIAFVYVFLRTPWGYAGHPMPFITLLEYKFHLGGIPTIYFDGSANPTVAGAIVTVSGIFFGILLLIVHRITNKSNSKSYDR